MVCIFDQLECLRNVAMQSLRHVRRLFKYNRDYVKTYGRNESREYHLILDEDE
jgi:hypothetical protein